MFLSRVDFLKEKIKLYNIFSNKYNEPNETLDEKCELIRNFLKNEIKTFASEIIKGTLTLLQIDHEFMQEVYLFDTEMYEQIFIETRKLEEVKNQYKFKDIIEVAPSFAHLPQSIGYFEWAYEQLAPNIKNSKEHYELYKNLVKIHFNESYPRLDNKIKKNVLEMLQNVSSLPSDKVKITNYGNGFNLYKKEENNVLTCHSKYTQFSKNCINDNEYEIKDDKGLLMCAIPSNSSGYSGFIFRSENLGNYSRWIISLCDPNSPSQGYFIKSKANQAYLCTNHERNVLLDPNIDDEKFTSFAWKLEHV